MREKMSKGRMPRVREKPAFEQRLLDLARVTRVVAGGKRLRFRACLVIGDKKGSVGIGIAKAHDVAAAVTKAFRLAQKKIIKVPIVNETIPHQVNQKYKAAKVLLKPAVKGRGIIAGGAVRIIMEMAGVKNITAKILGSKNKINNAKATIAALKQLR